MDSLTTLTLDDTTMLRAPAHATTSFPAGVLALDPVQPNWIGDGRPRRPVARAVRRQDAAA